MTISKANINYLHSDSFCSVSNEGLTHVKRLPYFSVVQATEGSYDITLENRITENTGEGGFFVAPAHIRQTIVHHVCPASARMSARWIFLDLEINRACRLDQLYRFPSVIRGVRKDELHALFDRFFRAGSVWEKHSIIYTMVEMLTDLAEPVFSPDHPGISAAIDFIMQNLAKPFTVCELAQIAHMSESNFYSAFKKQFGDSPISYINQCRLSAAAEKIIHSSLSIKEIASSVGIEDSFYFSKLFKRKYGHSPKEYRSLHQH